MGPIGYFLWIFLTVAALTLPLFVALARPTSTSAAPAERPITTCGVNPRGQVAKASVRVPGCSATCLFLFQLANASILPCRGGSRIRGRKSLLARRLGIDRPAADYGCRASENASRASKRNIQVFEAA
jgi:hypothetical protein